MHRLGALSFIALASCEGPFVQPERSPPPPAQAASVTISPDSATITVDDTLQLHAVVRDSAGQVLTDRYLSWWSPDVTIANLDGTGLATGLTPGRAEIHLQVDTVADSATLFVVPYVFTTIATGGNHACVTANNTRVYCWGVNAFGQVGIGTTSLVEPVADLTLQPPPVVAVRAGATHTCALTASGVAWCWGDNGVGALGRGSNVGDPLQPAPVASSLRFQQLTLGVGFSCGITTLGVAACWGNNDVGQLGVGGTGPASTPQPVIGSVTSLSVGAQHACALLQDSTAWCWGANGSGQLGDSDTIAIAFPTPVAGAQTWTAISAGGPHSCALTSGGAAYCWGANDHGQSGSGLPDLALLVPSPVSGGLQFLQISAGGNHTCGIAVDSLAYCWGANTSGQIGDSSTTDRAAPVPVAGGLHFARIAAGAGFTCGISGGVVAYCWGDGTRGQLGQPQLGNHTVPTRVAGQ